MSLLSWNNAILLVLPFPASFAIPFNFFHLKLCCWFSFPSTSRVNSRLPLPFFSLPDSLPFAIGHKQLPVSSLAGVIDRNSDAANTRLQHSRNVYCEKWGIERVPARRHIMWLLVVEGCNTVFCSDHVRREGVRKTDWFFPTAQHMDALIALCKWPRHMFTNADKLHPLPTSPSLMVPPKTRHPPS